MGRLREGFEDYRWRWASSEAPHAMAVLPAPVWEGESLAGKTIVVYFEQGLGDTLHFVRYLKLLARSAGHVIAVVQPPLLTLMRSIPEAEFTTTFDGLSC